MLNVFPVWDIYLSVLKCLDRTVVSCHLIINLNLALQQQLLLTIGHLVAQSVGPLLSHWFFFSSNAHIPPWTASNSTGFKSPYSPDATSMTKPEADNTDRGR